MLAIIIASNRPNNLKATIYQQYTAAKIRKITLTMLSENVQLLPSDMHKFKLTRAKQDISVCVRTTHTTYADNIS